MLKLENLHVLNQVYNIVKQTVHASAIFNSYPINQNSSLMTINHDTYYENLKNTLSSVWGQERVTESDLIYTNYINGLIRFTNNPNDSFYQSNYHFLVFNNLVTKDKLQAQQDAIQEFFQELIDCYPLAWQTAKIESYPITTNLFQVTALLTTDPVPIFTFVPVSRFLIEHMYSPNTMEQLNPEIEKRLQIVNSHYLTSKLTDDLLPENPQAFWQPVINLNSKSQAEKLTEQQIHLLNQSFQDLLQSMIDKYRQGMLDTLKARQKTSQLNDREIKAYTENSYNDTNDFYYNQVKNLNIYRLLPETIVTQFSQPTSDERATEHIQTVLQQHPEIMTYLSSYLD